jgi:threonine dehydratase
MQTQVTLETIRAARDRIADKIYRSPCPHSLMLSRRYGCEIYCKLDHLQVTGSFKERGARNKLLSLPPEQTRHGVIAASAGNHALGVSYHGQTLGIPVTVIMPKWAPLMKVQNCRGFGARVIQQGENLGESLQVARAMAESEKLTFIHGFDDPNIISGAGTMGLEILEDVPDVDAIIVPVGGGGLIAGIGVAVKALKPSVRIIGVEPVNAPTMKTSFDAGKPVAVPPKPTLADGLAVTQVGQLCFDIAKEVVDDLILIDETQIASSVVRLLELEKQVVEGAGAAPLAAILNCPDSLRGKKVVLCLCGGNIDLTLISRVIERGLAADGRLCRISVSISDRPGSLASFLTLIASTGASIKEVTHDRNFGPADVQQTGLSAILETRDAEHIRQVHDAIERAGIQINPSK